jgi:ParB family chromosome partitioning protein
MGFFKKKPTGSEVLLLPFAQIRPNPDQPRTVFEDGALLSLAESIRRYGLLQPISVRRAAGGYEIIAGERRFRAAAMAGLASVPCLVYDVDGERGAFLSIVENLLREDLNMFETAAAMDKLCREHGLTQVEVAARLSLSQSTVANKLRLLRFPPALRERILAESLTERHARALLRLPPSLWERALERISSRRLNVEGTEKLIEEMLTAAPQRKPRRRGKQRGALRDVRVFYNSVDRAVEMVRRLGVSVETRREEEETATVLIIRVPKLCTGEG